MRLGKLRQISRTLRRALALRCPECGYGALYERGFRLHDTCSYCQVRYERAPGESLGAAYLTGALTLSLVVGGFWLLDSILDSSDHLWLGLWILAIVALNLLFYRYARALWVGVAHLGGGVHPDPDYEREYIAPRKTPAHYEPH
jgi:uncharacterized protein (DUF983 family)